MFDDNLTGLTGMEAPALDGGNAPVVRYQDLQRGHSPASAGAPAFGSQRSYAPEVIEAAEEVSEIGYGPLEIPDYVAPYYGAAQAGGYGAPFRMQDGAYEYEINPDVSPVGVTILKAPSGYRTGAVTSGAAYDAIVKKARDENPYRFANEPKTTRAGAEASDAPTRGVRGTTGSDARSGAATGAAAFLEAFNIGAGYKEDPKKKFQASNQSGNQLREGTDWGKVALWGGVAVAGIVATVLVVRAVSSKE